jgi:hypothetical protein
MTASDLGSGRLVHNVCDAEFAVDDATLHGRWGVVPAGVLLEPLHRQPLPVPSWLLDLDMYTLGPKDFDPPTLLRRTEAFMKTIYRFFRWSVTDKLLRDAGGEL